MNYFILSYSIIFPLLYLCIEPIVLNNSFLIFYRQHVLKGTVHELKKTKKKQLIRLSHRVLEMWSRVKWHYK